MKRLMVCLLLSLILAFSLLKLTYILEIDSDLLSFGIGAGSWVLISITLNPYKDLY